MFVRGSVICYRVKEITALGIIVKYIIQMAHIIILFLFSLFSLSLSHSLILYMDARLMLIINPPSTIPLLLIVLPLVVRSSTEELGARRIVCTSSFRRRRLRASSIRISSNVSLRSSLATAVDASVSERSSIDTDGFDRRRL